jgi:hypothetical protein
MVPGTGGVPQFQRIPLPGTEFLEEEPLYVNAKQYRRILKRRQARAKLEAEGRIPKERPVRIIIVTVIALDKLLYGILYACEYVFHPKYKIQKTCACEICKYMC